jgi:hypothetical protein
MRETVVKVSIRACALLRDIGGLLWRGNDVGVGEANHKAAKARGGVG